MVVVVAAGAGFSASNLGSSTVSLFTSGTVKVVVVVLSATTVDNGASVVVVVDVVVVDGATGATVVVASESVSLSGTKTSLLVMKTMLSPT